MKIDNEDEVHQVFYAVIQKVDTKDSFSLKPQNHRIFKSM